jgi:predicted DNA-binding transcriptional regulator AlpA
MPEFCKITGMSESYVDQLFEKQYWELTEAVRLAGFLKMNIETIVHWPKPRQF